jgi:hypothetical protein
MGLKLTYYLRSPSLDFAFLLRYPLRRYARVSRSWEV